MKHIPLAEICESIDYGVTASASSAPIGPKFLRITDIQDGNVNWDSVPYCVSDERKLVSSKLIAGDIVFARTGATTGKSFLISSCPANAVFASYLIRVRPSRSVIPTYLGHFFNSPNYWNQISLKAVGAAQPGINASKLKELEIPLPPLEEQKRIAAILDQADALRRLRRRALDRLNTLGQAIFHEMFGDRLATSSVSLLGDLTTKIGSGATPRGGDAAYKAAGIPLIRSMNVRDGYFSERGLAYLDDNQAALLRNVQVKAKDVLLNITGASVARVCIAPEEMDGARVNQHVAIIRTTPDLIAEFLEAFLLLPQTKNRLLSIAESGATRQAITKSQISELEIPNISLVEQERFVDRLMRVQRTMTLSTAHGERSEDLFTSLQHRAFRGEL